MPNKCVFCQDGDGATVDHIPPRGFFKKPRPVNTVTVPSCEICRTKYAGDDEHARNLLVSLDVTETHPDVHSDISLRRDRSFNGAPKKAQVLIDKMLKADLGGNLQLMGIFDLRQDAQMDAFFDRICRGVLYDAAGVSYFEGKFEWGPFSGEMAKERWDSAPPEMIKKDVGAVFSYLVMPIIVEGKRHVFLRFYQAFVVHGFFTLSPAFSSPAAPG